MENNNEEKKTNIIILSAIIVNMIFGVTNRILQIVDYCIKVYNKEQKYNFINDELKIIVLTFCLLPTLVNIFMMSLYTILHKEEILTLKVKIKNFILFILSMEFLYPLGVQMSLRTKYSYDSDDPVITMRFINAINFMLVSLPQLLILPINCSAKGYSFHPVDIASLIFSIIFMIWSVGYYFICIVYNNPLDDYITEYVEKNKIE